MGATGGSRGCAGFCWLVVPEDQTQFGSFATFAVKSREGITKPSEATGVARQCAGQ